MPHYKVVLVAALCTALGLQASARVRWPNVALRPYVPLRSQSRVPTVQAARDNVPNLLNVYRTLTGDSVPGDQLPIRQLPIRQLPIGQLPIDQLQINEMPVRQLPNGQLPSGHFPNGILVNGYPLNGQLSNGNPVDDYLPNGQLPNMPNGRQLIFNVPIGNMPSVIVVKDDGVMSNLPVVCDGSSWINCALFEQDGVVHAVAEASALEPNDEPVVAEAVAVADRPDKGAHAVAIAHDPFDQRRRRPRQRPGHKRIVDKKEMINIAQQVLAEVLQLLETYESLQQLFLQQLDNLQQLDTNQLLDIIQQLDTNQQLDNLQQLPEDTAAPQQADADGFATAHEIQPPPLQYI